MQTFVLFLHIGPDKTLTSLHKALLPASTLAILDAKAAQQMIQQTPMYFIEDHLPETFEMYRAFLYTGKIFSSNAQVDQDYADNGLDETHDDGEWMRLAHMYLMGLDLDDERFRNAIVDALVEKVAETVCWPFALFTWIFRQRSRMTLTFPRTATQPASPQKSTPTQPSATSCAP
jgi:hypothetical protein